MSKVHIFTTALQPATKFVMDLDEHGQIKAGYRGGRVLWCGCCHQPRRARNCVVQCFYDGINVWCAPDKGCKAPRLIAAKKRREFRNRSAGQRARWARSA